MPIYEHFFTKCKMEFKLRCPLSEAAKAAMCPKCNPEAQKLVSGFGSKTGSYITSPSKALQGEIAENVGE